MLTKEYADFLRAAAQGPSTIDPKLIEIASAIEYEIRSTADRDAKDEALQDIGENCAKCLAEMVAALECDYDRRMEMIAERDEILERRNDSAACAASRAIAQYELDRWDAENAEELASLQAAGGDCESREDAEQRIQEDPLSIELAGTWVLGETPVADRAYILLGTGGPATRIVCELDQHMEPSRAWIEAQDWGTPWTEYRGDAISDDALLTYCGCLYFGEG